MAIVRRQSILGTIISFLGVIIGFITTIVFFPTYFTQEQIGIVRSLYSYAVLFSVISSLGFSQVIIKLFPTFKDSKSGHNGFLRLMLVFIGLGVLVTSILTILFKYFIVGDNVGSYFDQYYFLIVPSGICMLCFNLLDQYQVMHYKSVFGIFVKDFVLRLLILAITLLFGHHVMDYSEYIVSYYVVLCMPLVIVLVYIKMDKTILLSLPKINMTNNIKKEVINLASYGFLSTGVYFLLKEIDIIMLQQMLGFKETGIYSVLFPFAIIISIPARAVIRSSTGIISEAWLNNDLQKIQNIYTKSSNSLLVIASLLFIGIWCNLDSVFVLMRNGSDYEIAKYVVFFIGIGQVIELGAGVNSQIIATSKYYRYNFIFSFILLGLIVISNSIFIPIYGVVGAAIGTCVSLVIFNLIRFLLLYFKFKLNPFSLKTVWIIVFATATYLIFSKIMFFDNQVIQIAVKSMSISIFYLFLVYVFNLAPDINQRVNIYWLKFQEIFSK